jgi:pyridoxamine 5'-phosphate oxidase
MRPACEVVSSPSTVRELLTVANNPLDLAAMRQSYELNALDERDIRSTWMEQFEQWFADALASELVVEPNAIQLATANTAGRASVRTVLAKDVSAAGLVFYTGYDSAKGIELTENPYAEAIFAWLPLQRQVRLSGPVQPISRALTQSYFSSRPRGSQLGAWASPQSQVVAGRAELDAALAEVTERFAGVDVVPAPPRWGGLRLVPESVEFWQGRANRMHDRLRFTHDGPAWVLERLAP